MRKYIAVASMFFKTQMIYRFDVFMSTLELLGRILFSWIIWSAVYAQQETVEGFTFQAMIFYYVTCSFLSSLDSSSNVGSTVSNSIRGGTFSKNMVIPMNPLGYYCAQILGVAGYNSIFSVIAIALVITVFPIGVMLGGSLGLIALAITMIPLGIICMVCYYYLIGIAAFKFQDVGFFMYIQWTVRDFLTGSMVPLFLLPPVILHIVQYLPFPHVVYTPVMLLMGRMGYREGLTGLLVLSIWTTVLVIMNHFLYNRLRVKYDGVGI